MFTPDVPTVVAVGMVSVEDGVFVFEVGPGGKGNITNAALQIALRTLGTDAGVGMLQRCGVRDLPEGGSDAPDLDAMKVELCKGDGARLGRLVQAFGGPDKLTTAVRNAGGPVAVGPFARNLFLDAPGQLITFLRAANCLPLATIASGWKESLP